MITVLGKREAVNRFSEIPGFNVLPYTEGWSWDNSTAFLDEALRRGDQFLAISDEYTGTYLRELDYLDGAGADVLYAEKGSYDYVP